MNQTEKTELTENQVNCLIHFAKKNDKNFIEINKKLSDEIREKLIQSGCTLMHKYDINTYSLKISWK